MASSLRSVVKRAMTALSTLKPVQTCNMCNKNVHFVSIENELGETLRLKGFPYRLREFETLNYKKYYCPNCGSNDRDRLYKLYLEKFPLKEKSNIVDFAPSPQLQLYLKSLPITYRSADLFMENVDDKIDITDMKKYQTNMFDFFVCSHLLEHVDDKKTLKELRRILKKDGSGILMTPIINKDSVFDEDMTVTDIEERWRRFAQDDHIRLYSKNVFLKRIKEAGLNVKEITILQLGVKNVYKYGISMKSVLYIVRR